MPSMEMHMKSVGTFVSDIHNALVEFLQQVDTTLLGLSNQDAVKSPYIASMGVYAFKTDILLKLLRWRYPTSNDFGSEIIPAAVKERDVQVRKSYMEPNIQAVVSIFRFLEDVSLQEIDRQ